MAIQQSEQLNSERVEEAVAHRYDVLDQSNRRRKEVPATELEKMYKGKAGDGTFLWSIPAPRREIIVRGGVTLAHPPTELCSCRACQLHCFIGHPLRIGDPIL